VEIYLLVCEANDIQNLCEFSTATAKGQSFIMTLYTGCLKIREFRIQSVVGDHFSSPNMEIKKNRGSPHKDTLV
jgi:hypothetical protein